MRLRTVVALICASAVAAAAEAVAQADPSNHGGPFGGTLHAHFFDCIGPAGTPGSFDAVRQVIGAPWLLTNRTAAYDVKGAFDETTNTTVLFLAPGFRQNGLSTVACTFIGPISGDTILATGLLTPIR